jgi:hypothetical protein
LLTLLLPCSQEKGHDDEEGAIYFVPKGIDVESGEKGSDYYDRIADVIDRLQEKPTEEERAIAEAYASEVAQLSGEDAFEGEEIMARPSRRRSTARKTEEGTVEGKEPEPIDLSWKKGGPTFPTKSSRVGPEYQATDIPPFGSGGDQEAEGVYDQVWDPTRADKAGVSNLVHSSIVFSKKEAAMVTLHEQNYKLDHLEDTLLGTAPVDGSDWTDEEKCRFRSEIFRHRKDVGKVAKIMNKSVNSCMTYYLGTFKKSDDYRLLKTVCAEERVERQEEYDLHGLDACSICGDGGSLLICDGCEREFHMTCMNPPLAKVPEGRWECDECVNVAFYRARDRLIRSTRVFEQVKDDNEKCKADHISGDEETSQSERKANEEIKLRAAPHVLAAVKTLAASINMALAAPKRKAPDTSIEE